MFIGGITCYKQFPVMGGLWHFCYPHLISTFWGIWRNIHTLINPLCLDIKSMNKFPFHQVFGGWLGKCLSPTDTCFSVKEIPKPWDIKNQSLQYLKLFYFWIILAVQLTPESLWGSVRAWTGSANLSLSSDTEDGETATATIGPMAFVHGNCLE